MSNIENEKRLVKSDGIYMSIETFGPGKYYDIEIDRIGTYEQCLKWILHLSEKSWFTSKHAADFIKEFGRVTGNSIRGV